MSDKPPDPYHHPALDDLQIRFARDSKGLAQVQEWAARWVYAISRSPLEFGCLVTAPGQPIDHQRDNNRTIIAYLRREPK